MITKSRPTGERLRKQNGAGRLSRAGHPTLRGLDGVDGDLAGAAVLGGVEGDLLALDEAAQARALQRGGVDEHVLGAVVRLDEAEAFLVVVEFHGARNHRGVLFAGGAGRRCLEESLNPRSAKPKRNGPIVRPNVDPHHVKDQTDFYKAGSLVFKAPLLRRAAFSSLSIVMLRFFPTLL